MKGKEAEGTARSEAREHRACVFHKQDVDVCVKRLERNAKGAKDAGQPNT